MRCRAVIPCLLAIAAILGTAAAPSGFGEAVHPQLIAQASRPGETGTQPSDVGESGALAAEMEKRWSDAERIYRELLAAHSDRLDLWLRLADVLAAAGQPLAAAQSLAQAADLGPTDAELQLRTSAALAVAEQPAEA